MNCLFFFYFLFYYLIIIVTILIYFLFHFLIFLFILILNNTIATVNPLRINKESFEVIGEQCGSFRSCSGQSAAKSSVWAFKHHKQASIASF